MLLDVQIPPILIVAILRYIVIKYSRKIVDIKSLSVAIAVEERSA